MLTTMRYVLLIALRDRLLFMLFLALMAISGISYALASTMLSEQHATALVIAAETSRILLVMGMIIFVIFHVRQAYDSREMDVMLSRPISRAQLVLAYWSGFACIAFLLTLSAALTVGFLMPINWIGFGMWLASLLCETFLLSAFALFAALMLNSAVSATLSSFGIYILARMMGLFLITISSRTALQDVTLNGLLKKAITVVSAVTPRLDFFTKAEWITSGSATIMQDILYFGGQTLVFTPLLLLATIVDLNKRQF